MMSRKLLGILMVVVVSGVTLPGSSQAADLTRVLTSMDFENDQPFGFDLSPSFRHRIERSAITREGICDPTSQACPAYYSEVDARRTLFALDVDLAIGIYRDFQFHLTLPFIISDTTNLEFSDGVTRESSSIDPARASSPPRQPTINERFPYRLFEMPGGRLDGPTRSGLGDMSFGLAWTPFNNQRMPHVATMLLGIDYTAPTGKPARGGNTGVGRGVHELAFRIGASRRVGFLDPYMQFAYALPIRASNGLFRDYGPTQRVASPGMRGDITAGTEFILFSDDESGQHYTFRVGLDFGYTAQGRDYSPLFEGLSTTSCNGTSLQDVGLERYTGAGYPPSAGLPSTVQNEDIACAWIVQQTSNASDGPDSYNRAGTTFSHDGITDVDGYLRYGLHAGFSLQFAPLARFQLAFRGDTANPHGITGANSGRSTTGGAVSLDPADNERNPYYNPTLDYIGNRFRQESVFNFEWMARFSLQFQ